MIIKHERKIQKDIEIFITYPVKNKTIDRILALIKSFDTQIECYSDDGIVFVNTSDIYYIESVDKKTIICSEEGNFTVKSSLIQVHEKLKSMGFIKISKYCVLNVNKLKMIKPMVNSHLEAILSNGKCLYVTRKYLANIRQILQKGV